MRASGDVIVAETATVCILTSLRLFTPAKRTAAMAPHAAGM
jgi:hypothetical protein